MADPYANMPLDVAQPLMDYARSLDRFKAPPKPVESGGFLPLSRYDDGSVGFDSNAGIVGMAKRAFSLPHDVLMGQVDPNSREAVERSFDMAGLAGAGASAFPGEAGELRAGLTAKAKTKAGSTEPTGLFDLSNLSRVPNVPQSDLPRYTPPRGVPARVSDLVADRGTRDKVMSHVQSGLDMGGANWYNADPLRDAFVKELGHDQGGQAFQHYMDLVAATSPRSEVGTNVRNASYYYKRLMSGEGMPEVGDKNPQPYGHMAQRLHQMNAQRVAGEGWEPLVNPKPASFVQNLTGNQRPVTVDTHAFRLPSILAEDPRFLEVDYQSAKDAPKQNIRQMVEGGQIPMSDASKTAAYWESQPKKTEYAALEKYYQDIAREMGITPAQAQAAAWVGGGKVTGLASDSSKPFMSFFDDRIGMTAQDRGQDPAQVLRDFIRGRQPLLSSGVPVPASSQPEELQVPPFQPGQVY